MKVKLPSMSMEGKLDRAVLTLMNRSPSNEWQSGAGTPIDRPAPRRAPKRRPRICVQLCARLNANVEFITLLFKMKKLTAEKVKVGGDIPSPRFGHTFTTVSPNKGVLFGGAIAQAGTPGGIQAGSSSPTKPSSTTSRPPAGKSSTSSRISYRLKGPPTLQWRWPTCR